MLIERECAREDCKNTFVPKVHNGIYCGDECRKISTNKKVLERYYRNKNSKGKITKRTCKTKNCNTVLSRYNKENVCESCKSQRLYDRLSDWGWGHDDIIKKMEALEF